MSTTLSFPANPALGQVYTSASGQQYLWDGVKWRFLPTGGRAPTAAPVAPAPEPAPTPAPIPAAPQSAEPAAPEAPEPAPAPAPQPDSVLADIGGVWTVAGGSALDFPANPSPGQVFTASNGLTWVWDGDKWTLFPSTDSNVQALFLPLTGGTLSNPGTLTTEGDITVGMAGQSAVIDNTGFVQLTSNGWPLVRGNALAPGTANTVCLFLNGQRQGIDRWGVYIGSSDTETGGNTGSSFLLTCNADDGTPLYTNAPPLLIRRSDGLGLVAGDPVNPRGIATKSYVDAHIGGGPGYLPLAGGQMTGELTLAFDPTLPLEAATKQYVDAVSNQLTGYLPITGGTINSTPLGTGGTPALTIVALEPVPGYGNNLLLDSLNHRGGIFFPQSTGAQFYLANAGNALRLGWMTANGSVDVYGVSFFASGALNLASASPSATSASAAVQVFSAGPAAGFNSGGVSSNSGQTSGTGNSGAVNVYSGNATGAASSGFAALYTGSATGTGALGSGQVSIRTGASTGTVGNISLITGVGQGAAGQSGTIFLNIGTPTGGALNGAVQINSSAGILQRWDPVVGLTLGVASLPVNLTRDPQAALEAATKQYVDTAITTNLANYLPLTGGTLSNPGTLTINAPETGPVGYGVNLILDTQSHYGAIYFPRADGSRFYVGNYGTQIRLGYFTAAGGEFFGLSFSAIGGLLLAGQAPDGAGSNSGGAALFSQATSGSGNSGTVNLYSGSASGTGSTGGLNLYTGFSSGGGSGSLLMSTGYSMVGTAGSINLTSGYSSGAGFAAGNINITSGAGRAANTLSGIIQLSLGAPINGGLNGRIIFNVASGGPTLQTWDPVAGLTLGTATLPVTLTRDPQSAMEAATKQYVDAHAGSGGGGIAEAPTDGQIYGRQGSTTSWLPVLPTSGGTVAGNLTVLPSTNWGGTYQLMTVGSTSMNSPGIMFVNNNTPQVFAIERYSTALYISYGTSTSWQGDLARFASNAVNFYQPVTLSSTLALSANAVANLQAVPLQQLTSTVAGYLPLAGGTMTGTLTSSTPETGPNGYASNIVLTSANVYPSLLWARNDGQFWQMYAWGSWWGLQLTTAGSPVAFLTFNATQLNPIQINMATIFGGNVTLANNATINLHAVPLQQLNSTVANYLPLTGGTLSGNLTISQTGTASASLTLNTPSATGPQNILIGNKNAVNRWTMVLGDDTVESGGNAGSDFEIYRYSDTGAVLDSPLHITRATGRVYITNEFTMLGPVDLDASMSITGGANLIPANNACSCGYGGQAWQQVMSYDYGNASDPRDKKHVHPAPAGALDEVNRVPVVRYRWNRQDDAAPLHTGFLATDVADVLGSDRAAVMTGEDERGSLALSLMDMVATLWQAVQELSANLEARTVH